MVVDELRDQLLAAPALARDEDGSVGRRDPVRQLDRASEARRRAEHRHELAVAVLACECFLLRLRFPRNHDGVCRAADQDLQVRRRKRFREVVPRAGTQRLETRFDARVTRDHDGDGARMRVEADAQQLHP